jgi:IBR domain, a half RING-finger domain
MKETVHMPPKCCQNEITMEQLPNHILNDFEEKFPKHYRRKHQEAMTSNKTYCPKKDCGNWIRPKYFVKDTKNGRQKGTCSRCKTNVCQKCNMKWHPSGPCKVDADTQKVLDLARKKDNYQRCYSCGEMVERSSGCNHMTCKCGAQFCMLCGKKWRDPVCRTECELISDRLGNPVPNFDPAMVRGDYVEDAALHQMFPFLNGFGGPANPRPPRARQLGGLMPPPPPPPPPPMNLFGRPPPPPPQMNLFGRPPPPPPQMNLLGRPPPPPPPPPPQMAPFGRPGNGLTHGDPAGFRPQPQRHRGIAEMNSGRNRPPNVNSRGNQDNQNHRHRRTPTESEDESSSQETSGTESSELIAEDELEWLPIGESQRQHQPWQQQQNQHRGRDSGEDYWARLAEGAAVRRQRREIMERMENLRLGEEQRFRIAMGLTRTDDDDDGQRPNRQRPNRPSQPHLQSESQDEELARRLQEQFWLGEM